MKQLLSVKEESGVTSKTLSLEELIDAGWSDSIDFLIRAPKFRIDSLEQNDVGS